MKTSSFKWNPKRDRAAIIIATGGTQKEAALDIGVTERTINAWNSHEEFRIEVDRLTFMVGIASRAERLRLANRVIKSRTEFQDFPITKADLLDWLKFAQSETDGVKLDLAALFTDAAQMAGS